MPSIPSPFRLFARHHAATGDAPLAGITAAIAALPIEEVLRQLETRDTGLSQSDATARLRLHGPNLVTPTQQVSTLRRFLRTCANPLVVLLLILAGVSIATHDVRAASVITLMIVIGVGVRFVQESRANTAAARLTAMIHVTATVLRDGTAQEIALHDIVPGDIITLSAGDVIPADTRLIATKDLFIDQAVLTGESFPVEKFAQPLEEPIQAPDHLVSSPAPAATPTLLEQPTLCFLGTSVQSGTGTAVVVTTGAKTYFGGVAGSVAAEPPETAFDRGVDHFAWLMISFIVVMAPLVFLINGLTKHDWTEAFFFALAVSVGLTPEMLPMIVSVCLTQGAIAMSRRRVIVRRINAIQNFGAMDVLCTDKTGTLTLDQVILERHCDVTGVESDRVFRLAFLSSHFQTGLHNVLDRAVLSYAHPTVQIQLDAYRKVDEIPFDFTRRIMSVVVNTPDEGRFLIAKGAPEQMIDRCTHFESRGESFPIAQSCRDDLLEEYTSLSTDGFRVLAVAYRQLGDKAVYEQGDEQEMTLAGYVAFLDPPKDTAKAAIMALEQSGVTVKTLTGDNDLVARKICRDVGIPVDRVLLGSEVEQMTDADLAAVVDTVAVFARLSPMQKPRIIRALQARSHVVGFLGDGINDAPGLHEADIGISVDSAVDVAKAAADIVLLEKSLLVLQAGVLEGRKVFANVLKYIRMGASSNFGNMLSILGASAWLPFVPMAPLQILANNLLYDISQLPIPTDNVDPEQIAKPQPWAIDKIRRFILWIGPISSIFDYTTFFVLYYFFRASTPSQMSLFQTGWFVESLMTQTLIIHVIRTNKIPLLQSRPSWQLMSMSVIMLALAVWLPTSPLAPSLGLVGLPPLYWPILVATLLGYVLLTQGVKTFLLRTARLT